MAASSKLFKPLKVGDMNLQNRLIMAPLTRFRADDNHVPLLPMVKTYYTQRASSPGTLLISEAAFISPEGTGYASAPGLWSKDQLKAWKEVTDSVHEKGSFIYAQLWALGRAAGEAFMKERGLDVVSASNIPLGEKGPVPKPLTEEEIQKFIQAYATAAKNAVFEGGFDGVEIHSANGYLADQFLQDSTNRRTDRWGGSIENRSRFSLEVVKAVIAAVGASKTGIRLSPYSTFQLPDKKGDPAPQFSDLISKLSPLNLAYVHVVESRIQGSEEVDSSGSLDFAFKALGPKTPMLIAGGFTTSRALEAVDVEHKDADVGIVFGRYFISNPDLVFRIKEGIELNKYDRSTFYKARSEDGYTDYPFSKEWESKASL